jgi:hypothetical protein
MENKIAKGPNDWLTNDIFLQKAYFDDKFYLKELGGAIRYYVDHCPIPMITSWDHVHKRIFFQIGSFKCYIPVNNDIPTKEAIYLAEKQLLQFYPQYEIVTEIPYSELPREILLKDIKDGIVTFDESFNVKKIEKEIGIIIKIFVTDDSFYIQKKNVIESRLMTSMNISTFLKEFRNLQNSSGEDKKLFIEENSIVSQEIKQAFPGSIEIRHKGKMMVNFFRINLEKMEGHELIPLEPNIYQWGQFKIFFESPSAYDRCLKVIEAKDYYKI